MRRRIITEIKPPDYRPKQAHCTQNHKREPPGTEADKKCDQCWSEEIPQSGKRMRYALGKTAFFRGEPIRQRTCSRGKSRAFTQAENHAAHDQCSKTADETNQHGGAGPYDSAGSECDSSTEFVTQPSAPDLQCQICPPECGEHPAELNSAEMQVALNRRTRGVHVDPVNIGKPVHQADHKEHEIGRGKNPLQRAPRIGRRELSIGGGHMSAASFIRKAALRQ